MRHEHDDLNGHLEIKSREYRTSQTEIVHYPPNQPNDVQARSSEIVGTFTPRDVVNLLLGGLNDFTFAGGGNGCRYWQSVCYANYAEVPKLTFISIMLIAQYEQKRWIVQGTTTRLFIFLSNQYSTRQFEQQIVIQQGTFDVDTVQQRANQHWTTIQEQVSGQYQTALQQYQTTQTTQNRDVAQRWYTLLQALHTSAQAGSLLVQARREDEESDGEEEDDD
ncbi:hypothetical protein LTR49_027528 [Elasticomyces elasticus]|nr:hypothetical protein LTR49_027528 [Elasticomyces elasticus]KAK5746732.1 hypothetical protein LTS12_022629 [Elasticomyces elasticus]